MMTGSRAEMVKKEEELRVMDYDRGNVEDKAELQTQIKDGVTQSKINAAVEPGKKKQKKKDTNKKQTSKTTKKKVLYNGMTEGT